MTTMSPLGATREATVMLRRLLAGAVVETPESRHYPVAQGRPQVRAADTGAHLPRGQGTEDARASGRAR